jgi:hypothetical protein
MAQILYLAIPCFGGKPPSISAASEPGWIYKYNLTDLLRARSSHTRFQIEDVQI